MYVRQVHCSRAVMKHRYAYLIGLSVATIMMPCMWYLWLYPGSGNANFFYNQTLVYQFFLALIIVEFVKATMLRDQFSKLEKLKSD